MVVTRLRTGLLLGLVYAGLVVLVLLVEARLQVVQQRGRRQQLAHHVVARQQQARGGGAAPAPAPHLGGRGGLAARAPLLYLALDVERAALGPAGATTMFSVRDDILRQCLPVDKPTRLTLNEDRASYGVLALKISSSTSTTS